MTLKLRLDLAAPDWPWLLPMPLEEIEKAVKLMAAVPGLEEVEAVFTDDASIASANASFLGLDGPTNVLSFPSDDFLGGSLLLSLNAAAREAFIFNHSPSDYLLILLGHGLAHLAGCDHGPAMAQLEDAMLAVLKPAKFPLQNF